VTGGIGRPGIAAVSFAGNGGGLAYVARLLRHTFAAWDSGSVWEVALNPARYGSVSYGEELKFGARVLAAQAFHRIDWLAFNHLGIARVQRFVPPNLRRPYLVFVHDVEAWDPALPADRLATLRAATLRVANSGYTAARVARAHPNIGRVVPCPLGLLDDDVEGQVLTPAPAGLEPAAPASGLGSADDQVDRVGPLSVLIVGRMHDTERYKGHDELLESWPEVVARVPGAQLVIVGLGNDRVRLRDKARALGVGSQVLFCGFVPAKTLAALWERVAVFAMPSAREGFGLVYLEAMRAGRPCIGSTSDAAGDIIIDRDSGFLIDRSNRGALTEALVTLLTDESMRRTMGEAGRRRFLAEFTAERFATRLRTILEETLPASPSGSRS
jgi:phosphatidyl-myo-inositol dimannoside synthase